MTDLLPTKINRKVPAKWNYEDSVEKVKAVAARFTETSIEFLSELYVAREKLAKRGRPVLVKGDDDKEVAKTWSDFCNEVGLKRNTVNGWLRKYDPERKEKIEEPPTEGPQTVEATIEDDPEAEGEESTVDLADAPPVVKVSKAKLKKKSRLEMVQAILDPLNNQLEWVGNALTADGAAPTSLIHFAKNIEVFKGWVESWLGEVEPCTLCLGTGTVATPKGEEVLCTQCVEGVHGTFKVMKK